MSSECGLNLIASAVETTHIKPEIKIAHILDAAPDIKPISKVPANGRKSKNERRILGSGTGIRPLSFT
jgi:hypothetical protein